MNKQFVALYRAKRKQQLDGYGIHCHLMIDGVDQRQFTGGGAAYGFHAVAAYLSTKRTLHFNATMRADMTAYRKRCKAAKKGAKTRKLNAA